MRWSALILVVVLLAGTLSTRPARSDEKIQEVSRGVLHGSWDGGDWGDVEFRQGGEIGEYPKTFNGLAGTLNVTTSMSIGHVLSGRFYESGSKDDNPTREGYIFLKINSFENGYAKTITCTWQATEKSTRSRGGQSNWTRKEPPPAAQIGQ